MPKLVRVIEYYTCDFKCGTKAKEKWKMIDHEKICFCNPKNKACRICQFCNVKDGEMWCNKLGLHIKADEKNHKVYDNNDCLVWEFKGITTEECIFQGVEYLEKVNNKNRPFPTKNCPYFILSKKRY